MTNRLLKDVLTIGCAALFAAAGALAQDHKWAGRDLSELEWTIHGRLAVLPSHGIFDTLNFSLEGKTVTLWGEVISEATSRKAERTIKLVDGVDAVVNKIEILPASRQDDVLRMNVYRAIYEKQPLEKYGTRALPSIHIVVKGGWVKLEGVVDSEEDRTAAYLRALKVSAHVSDNLRVAPDDSDPAPGPTER